MRWAVRLAGAEHAGSPWLLRASAERAGSCSAAGWAAFVAASRPKCQLGMPARVSGCRGLAAPPSPALEPKRPGARRFPRPSRRLRKQPGRGSSDQL